MRKYFRLGLAFAVAIGTGACDTKSFLLVQSDTEWSGVLIGKEVDRWHETGNVTTRLGKGTFCWEFSKLTEQGYLRAFVREESLLSAVEFRHDETTAAMGGIHGCITVE